MLELKNLTIGYGSRILLENVSERFGKGRLVALLGRNGSGKSTLLKAISGIYRPLSGEIAVCGRNPSVMKAGEAARHISFVSTEKTRIPDLKCRTMVALGRSPYTNWLGQMAEEDISAVDRVLEAVGMLSYADRTMDSISDGECQRIMIARALAQDTPVMLLDEPTAFLDLPGRYETVSLLHRLAREQGKCILFSTHDLDTALDEADDIALIDRQSIIKEESRTICKSGKIGQVFGIEKYK